MKINCILVSCHKRPRITAEFLKSLSKANENSKYYDYLLIVDTSNNKINKKFSNYNYSFKVLYVHLESTYWWCSAMKYGFSWLLDKFQSDLRILMVNDDIAVDYNVFQDFVLSDKKAKEDQILVGAISRNSKNSLFKNYGIRYVKNNFFRPEFSFLPMNLLNKEFKRFNTITFNGNWVSLDVLYIKRLEVFIISSMLSEIMI